MAESAPAEARGSGPGGRQTPDRSGRQRKLVREVVNLREQERLARQATGRSMVRRQITIDPRAMTSPRRRRRDTPSRAAASSTAPSKESARIVRIESGVSVGELARMMGVKAPEVQRRLMALGTMASINQSVDADTAGKVAAEFGYQVQDVGFNEEAFFDEAAGGSEGEQKPRPPVVTVMGHVDHGKTSLLDAIRRTNVVAGEAGGITQHIGAYQVAADGRKLTFIDTPGHEAFTAMRARGAQVTDMVVLVVAATEGVMPQTVEAIDHAKAAGVPILVAVNKIDLPGANPKQIRQRLMEHSLVPEEFGGDIICVDVSATKGTGIEQLLEMLALQSEVLELRGSPELRASGIVLEARLDKGRGPLATLLVQDGTLRRGDVLVVGTCYGRVRALEDEHGQRLDEAGPATPVQVIGLSGVPEAGQAARVVESDRAAKEVVDHRLAEQRGRPAEGPRRVSLEELFAGEGGGIRELRVVLKADVHGSVEAVRDALLKLSTDAVKVDVIHAGVGAVTETDVMLAKASEALIFGFGVRPDPVARRAAEGQGVEIHSYRIIYELTDYVRQRMAGLLPPTETEKILGRAEVRQTFSVPKVGTIAGCYVSEGQIRRNALCRLLRDGAEIYQGRVGSLRRFKDDVREVASGFECGIGIEGYNDVKIGDVIEAYEVEKKAQTL
jgi:translation initiation factor IF-2